MDTTLWSSNLVQGSDLRHIRLRLYGNIILKYVLKAQGQTKAIFLEDPALTGFLWDTLE